MSDEIFFDGVKYISASDAAALSGFTRDYIGRLCRDGKLRGKRVGTNWYVDHGSLKKFLVEAQYHKSIRREQLANERAREYHATVSASAARVAPNGEAEVRRRHGNVTPLRPAGTSAATHVIATAPAGMAHAAVHAAHASAQVLSPLAEFVHKLIALSLALMLTFGTYALVDPQYARFAARSVASHAEAAAAAYRSLTGGGFAAFAGHANERLAAAAADPSAAAFAAAGLVPDLFERIARAVHAGVDDIVYALAFSPDALASLAQARGGGERGSVVVRVASRPLPPPSAPSATPPASSSASASVPARAGAVTVVHNPVIERVIETERLVAQSGGITPAQLDASLGALESKLSAQILTLASAQSSTAGHVTSVYREVAQTQRIDQLRGTRITDASIEGGSISGADIAANSLSVSGGTTLGSLSAATTTIQGDLSVSGSLTVGSVAFSTASTTDLLVVNATTTNLFAQYASTTYATSTSLYASSLTADNATSVNFHAASLAADAATSTTIFASVAHFASAVIDSIASLLVTDLVATNATTTNLAVSSVPGALLSTDASGAVASTTIAAPLSFANGTLSVAQASSTAAGYLSSADWNAFNGRLSTTSLGLIDKGFFFSTTSADYHLAGIDKGFFFSTTSASNFLSLNQGAAFSTTSAEYLLNSSTTIPRTTLANSWAPLQTFSSGFLSQASSTVTGLLTSANSSSTLASLGTLWLPQIANGAGSLLAADTTGKVVATTTIGTGYLSGALGTINNTVLNAGGSITITAASSTLLANDNTFSGANVFSQPLSLTSTTGTTTIAGGQGFAIGGSQLALVGASGRIGIGTAAPTTGLDIRVPTDISGNLTISGGSALTITATGPLNQTGLGQVSFAGNVDALNGLDVTNANFTVGGSKFTVAPATGNFSAAGAFSLGGALWASSTAQITGASRFYSTLRADGLITAAGSGTGLSVANNAEVGGTLSLSGAGIFGSSLDVAGAFSAATTTLTGQLSMSSQKITGVANPAADQDAANKLYVDSVAQGLDLKDSVRAATTGNIALTGEQTIDGVSLVSGDRVLVKNQFDETKNGIYSVSAGAWARAADADDDSEVHSGMFTFIQEGTANANSGWVLTTAGSITLGVSLLDFTQFSGAGQIIAGTGIEKSGNTLNVNGTADRIVANADSLDIASTYAGQTSISTVGTLTSGSLGNGFGNIDIGNSSITAGQATFSSIVGSAITGSGNLTINGTGSFTGDVSVAGTLSAATTTFSGNIALGGKKITGLADPTSAQEAATKAYVDAIAQGLTVKASVRAATTGNIALTGEQTIDGVSLVSGDRILVKSQSAAAENGIYVVAAGAWSRAADADENSEVTSGMYAFVEEGTENANTGWSLLTPNPVTLGTTALSFSQFSGAADWIAGDGLTKSGTTFNVGGVSDRITVTADAVDIASTYAGQNSISTVGALTSGSIASGFGAINIGSNSLTAGAGMFSSIADYGTLSIGGTATTTIYGNGATSTFSGGLSLASGNLNLASGGSLLVNNASVLSATTLGSSVLNSSLTSVGPLDSGSITTGFGAINIGSDTLDAGNTTLAHATTTTLYTGTASTTNLFATAAHFGTLSLGSFPAFPLTKGYTLVGNDAGVAQATSSLFLSSTGNVGIGTTNPQGTLDIAGAGGIRVANQQYIRNGDSAGTASFYLDVSKLNVRRGDGANTGAQLNVYGGGYFSGNVGIGTTSPSEKLQVNGNVKIGVNSSIGNAILAPYSLGGLIIKPEFNINDVNSAVLEVQDWASNPLVTFKETGNVGIGTTSPQEKLHIVDTGTGSQGIRIEGNSGKWFDLGRDNSTGRFIINGNQTGTPLFDLQQNSVSRLYVDSTGNVGIGTTSPTAKLDVQGSGAGHVMLGGWGGDSSYGAISLNGSLATGDANFYSASGGGLYINTPSGSSGTHFRQNNGTDQMVIAYNGNVGIGTTTPQSTFAVESGANSNTATFSYAAGTGELRIIGSAASGQNLLFGSSASQRQGGLIYSNPNNSLSFRTNGVSDRMLIDSTGNVGIGTTTPTANLDVVNSSAGGGAYTSNTVIGAQRNGQAFINLLGGTASLVGLDFGDTNNSSQGRIRYDNSSDYLGLGTNGASDRLVINSSGNVGIGTTSPSYKLDVSGTAALRLYGANVYQDITNGTIGLRLQTASDASFGTYTNHPLVFKTNGTEQVRINTSGNVGIGTTGPDAKLYVLGTKQTVGSYNYGVLTVADDTALAANVGGAIAFQGKYTSAGAYATGASIAAYKTNATDGDNSFGLQFNTRNNGSAPAARMTIDNQGNVGIGTTTPAALLDVNGTARIGPATARYVFGTSMESGSSGLSITYGTYAANTAALQAESQGAGFRSLVLNPSGGNVGIGTTSPTEKLTVAGNNALGKILVTDSGSASADTRLILQSVGNGGTGRGVSLSFQPSGSASSVEAAKIIGLQETAASTANNASLAFQVANTSGTLTERMRIDSSGNVGIGTTSPGAKLDVNGSIWSGGSAGNGTLYLNSTAGSLKGFFYTDGDDSYLGTSGGTSDLHLRTQATNRVTVTAAGNVGIGTTSPLKNVEITSAGTAASGIRLSAAGNTAYYTDIVNQVSAATGTAILGNGANILTAGISSGTQLNFNNGTMQFNYLDLPKVTILGTGNVGIGTTSPQSKLHVYTGAAGFAAPASTANLAVFESSGDNGITIGSPAAGKSRIAFGHGTFNNLNYIESTGTSWNLNYNAFDNHTFSIAGAEKVRITNTGNVGIGTTGPNYKLDVVGDVNISASGAYKIGTGSALKYTGGVVRASGIGGGVSLSADGSANNLFVDTGGNINANSGQFYIQQSTGNVGIGTATPGAALDVYRATGGDDPRIRISQQNIAGLDIWEDNGVGHSYIDNLYDNASASLYFRGRTLGTPVNIMTLANTGNVGIGTTTPGYSLSVAGAGEFAASGSGLLYVGDANGANGTLKFNTNSGVNYIQSGLSKTTSSAADLRFTDMNAGATWMTIKSTGNVGIGTTTPGNKLVVAGNGTGSVFLGDVYGSGNLGAISLNGLTGSGNYNFAGATGDSNLYINRPSGGSIRFRQNNSDEVTINSSGNVGIGTTSPATKLDVYNGNIGLSYGYPLQGRDSGGTLRNLIASTGDLSGGATRVQSIGGGINFTSLAAASLMTILNSGNVGIGTTSPQGKLHVWGANQTGSSILLQNTQYSSGGLGALTLGQRSDGGLSVDKYGEADLFDVTGTGNVGIGTTSPGINGVAGRTYLTVQGNSGTGIGVLQLAGFSAAQSNNGNIEWYDPGNTSSSGFRNAFITSGSVGISANNLGGFIALGTKADGVSGTGAERMRIDSTGNVGIGTTTPGGTLVINGTTGQNLIQIASSTNQSILVVNQNGQVGVGTESIQGALTIEQGGKNLGLRIQNTAGGSMLQLSDATDFVSYYGLNAASNFAWLGPDSANQDDLVISSTGNVGIGTTTPWGRFAVQGSGTGTGVLANFANSALATVLQILDNGTAYFLGNLGIGTTTPSRKLSVADPVATAQLALAYDATRWTQFLTDASGDLIISPSGGDAFMSDQNFFACTSGCPAGSPTGTGNILAENKIGIGTTTPAAKLTIETQDAVSNFFQIASTTAQSLFTVNANGRVGVGTSTPFARLAVGPGGAIVTTENTLSDGATVSVNWLDGNQQRVTLGGNRNIVFTNYIAGQILRLVVCQDGTGNRTANWDANVFWGDAGAPTLSSAANACDIVSFIATNATSTLKIFGAAATGF